jgi:hypothetical protein
MVREKPPSRLPRLSVVTRYSAGISANARDARDYSMPGTTTDADLIERLRIALRESLRLQSHYAGLLNQYDGGERRTFGSPDEWIARLREVGTIKDDPLTAP